MLVLAVIATALILYGGDSTTTTATVAPPATRHVIATPRPSIPTAAPPTSLPPETVTTLTPSAAPTTAPSPVPTVELSPSSEASPPAVNPRTVVYSVTGTKQPFFDLVTVIYTDAQGLPQTDFDVSLPWSKTIVLNPGVQTKSVIATSLAGRLNCAINDAAGQTIAASTSNAMIATCAR